MGVSGGFFEGEHAVGTGIAIAVTDQVFINTGTTFSEGSKGGRVGLNLAF